MEHQMNKEEKFESIYRTYETDVFRLSMYFTKNEQAARDIVQKVFFEFYLHLDNINLEHARGYLFRSARNMAYNLTRDNKHRAQDEELEILDEIKRTSISVEDAYVQKEQKARTKELYESIMERMREKNPSWYEALHLVYCMEMPQDEVAEELGISKEVLYSRLHRAKKWIQKNYKEEYEKVSRKS